MPSEIRDPYSIPNNQATGTNWSLEDVIDFEYAVRLESRDSPERIAQRDEAVLASIKSGQKNRAILKAWLETIRADLFSPLWQPGSAFRAASAVANRAIDAISLIAGATLAVSLLRYHGTEPVNVSAFIGIFIILQFALALSSVVLFLYPFKAGRELGGFLGIRLLKTLFVFLVSNIARYAGSKIDAAHRNALEEATGDLRGIWSLYGPLFRWKSFTRIQEWALSFNCGALLAVLLTVLFSDRAFGWQTTLQLDPEWLHSAVRASAIPWSWLAGEGIGYPTLEEISGSRIVLKDGIRALSSENLVSWWPYLSLGIVFYGLFPRFAFNLWGRLKSNRSLKALSFSHAEANRIAERIRSSHVRFESNSSQSSNRADAPDFPETESDPNPNIGGRALCLIASDQHTTLPDGLLQRELSKSLNTSAENLEFAFLDENDRAEPDQISLEPNQPAQMVSIVFDSWMPPIEETKRLIKSVRNRIGQDKNLILVLFGPPRTDGETQPPENQDVAIWSAFVRKLGDPYCSLKSANA